MKTQDDISITFFNYVIGRGSLNGVINVTLGAFNFTPNDSNEVEADPVICCRLRTDLAGAKQLRDGLSSLIQQIEHSMPEALVEAPEPTDVVPTKRVVKAKAH